MDDDDDDDDDDWARDARPAYPRCPVDRSQDRRALTRSLARPGACSKVMGEKVRRWSVERARVDGERAVLGRGAADGLTH